MLTKRKELLKAIKFILPAIGQNESRRNLTNVYVEKKGKHIFLTAANAFIVKCVYLDMAQERNFKPFLIPRQILIYYRQILNNSKELVCDISRTELKIDTIGIKYKQPEYEYPNLHHLITGDSKDGSGNIYANALKKNTEPIGLNGGFLKDLMSSFVPKNMAVVKMETAGPTAPVRFTSQCGKYIALQLPVRIKW
jgi:hypothetical protein